MENDILKHRKAVQENILKSFGSEVSEDILEKAHQDGDVHKNGKWVWRSSANGGKGDWRVANAKTRSKNSDEIKSREKYPSVYNLINKLSGKVSGILYHPDGQRVSADSIIERIKKSPNNLASMLDVKGTKSEDKIDRSAMKNDKIAGSYAAVKNERTGQYELLTFKVDK